MWSNDGSILTWSRSTHLSSTQTDPVTLKLNYDKSKLIVGLRIGYTDAIIVLHSDTGNRVTTTNSAGDNANLIFRFDNNYW